MAERKKPPSSSATSHDHPTKRARMSRSSSSLQVHPKMDTVSASEASMSSSRDVQKQSKALTGPSTPATEQNGSKNVSTSRLVELLDLTGVSTHEDIAFRFGQIARSLMHDHVLAVSTKDLKTEYELLEVEFYLRKEGHEDPFAHGAPEQVESGKWYFHRSPRKSDDPTRSATSLTGYRGGTRKGLDLTFGSPVSSSYFVQSAPTAGSDQRPRGGILFRSIRRISDGAVISGPSLLVDELLRVCGCTNIAELVDEALAKNTSAFSSASPITTPRKCSISIRPRTNALAKKPTVYSSPRIGLDLSHPGITTSPTDSRIVFVQRKYRYFVNPILLTANGRSQTFLGIYNLLSEAEILNDGGVLDEVSRLTGIKRPSVEKYAGDYQDGKAGGKIGSFIGAAGKGASSSPSRYLYMMGSLVRLCGS